MTDASTMTFYLRIYQLISEESLSSVSVGQFHNAHNEAASSRNPFLSGTCLHAIVVRRDTEISVRVACRYTVYQTMGSDPCCCSTASGTTGLCEEYIVHNMQLGRKGDIGQFGGMY